jgi:Ca2+-binding RTX toxin-like protein
MIRDKDGGESEYTATVVINNVAPSAIFNAPTAVNEGSNITLSLTDPVDPSSADVSAGFVYAFDCGAGAGYGAYGSSSSVSCATTDNGGRAVRARIRDKDGSETEYTATVVINNVAPAPVIAGPTSGVRGQLRSFSGTFTDPGTADTHTLVWEVLDAASTLIASGSGASLSFTPTESGTYTVRFRVTDDDQGVGAASQVLTVSAVELQADTCQCGTVLVAGGTTGNDHLHFGPGAGAGDIVVMLNGVVLGTYQPTGRIIAYGLAGDDNLQVAGSIGLSAWLYGDAGDDRLKGGTGHDMLQGGSGADLVVGGSGRDLLIGGLGADRIVGNADDDILIAGATLHDPNEIALCAILREWTSGRSYEQRIANLNGSGNGTEFDNRLNANYFFKVGATAAETTVFDDQAADVLTGSSGLDWFIFTTDQDRATDLGDEAFINDLEFILS